VIYLGFDNRVYDRSDVVTVGGSDASGNNDVAVALGTAPPVVDGSGVVSKVIVFTITNGADV